MGIFIISIVTFIVLSVVNLYINKADNCYNAFMKQQKSKIEDMTENKGYTWEDSFQECLKAYDKDDKTKSKIKVAAKVRVWMGAIIIILWALSLALIFVTPCINRDANNHVQELKYRTQELLKIKEDYLGEKNVLEKITEITDEVTAVHVKEAYDLNIEIYRYKSRRDFKFYFKDTVKHIDELEYLK